MSCFHSFVFVMLRWDDCKDADDINVNVNVDAVNVNVKSMLIPYLWKYKQPCVLTSESNDRNKLIRWTCYGLVGALLSSCFGITGVVLLFWLMFLKWKVCFHLEQIRWNVHELLLHVILAKVIFNIDLKFC